MKKLIALAAAAMMLLSLFTACGKEPAANNDNDTEKTTTFTVGFDAEFPPYGYQDENGEYVGFDLDLAAEVCTRNGWELVKKPINWDSKDMELNTEVISCIWNGFTMQGREDKYTWSEAYVDNSQVIVVKKDSGIATYADLAGKIVAVQADSSALAALTENEDGSNAENIALAESFKQMVEVPDYNTAFLNLEAGAVDAIAMDIGVAQYQISQRGDEFVILDGTIASETYGIGFKLGNTELRDAVQKTLDEMAADGTFAKIAERRFAWVSNAPKRKKKSSPSTRCAEGLHFSLQVRDKRRAPHEPVRDICPGGGGDGKFHPHLCADAGIFAAAGPFGSLWPHEPLGSAGGPEKEQIPLLAKGGGIPAGAAPAQAVYLHFAGHPADAAADGGLLWALLYL